MRSRARFAIVAIVALVMLEGCAGATTPQPPMREARVIVRFKPGVDPSDAAFRARLAAATGVSRIDLVRAMSGDAWVLRMTCDGPSTSEADACDAAMRRVADSAWVVSIERDGREHHQ